MQHGTEQRLVLLPQTSGGPPGQELALHVVVGEAQHGHTVGAYALTKVSILDDRAKTQALRALVSEFVGVLSVWAMRQLA